MNKATSALRRSSIRLKSFTSGGHSDLNMIISDLKEVRSTAKAYMLAQQTCWRDMAKWASKEDNSTINSSMDHFIQLSELWTSVQNEFLEQVLKFKFQFDMILEGEQRVDKVKDHLAACELRETKFKKELKKASTKSTLDEVREIEEKISENKNSIRAAQIEITKRLNENEGMKAIRVKEGITKLSDGYLETARKSYVIFEAQKQIAHGLPDRHDVEGRNVHEIQYRGSEQAKQIVLKVIEKVSLMKTRSPYCPRAPTDPGPSLPSGDYDSLSPPPPPYSPSWQYAYRSRNGVSQNFVPVHHYDLAPDEIMSEELARALANETTL